MGSIVGFYVTAKVITSRGGSEPHTQRKKVSGELASREAAEIYARLYERDFPGCEPLIEHFGSPVVAA